MSSYDGPELDEDEIAELYDDPDTMTPEDIFKMVMINKVKKTKVWVELQDKDGDQIELADMIEQLVNYVKDKLSEEDANQINDQILPLMSQSLASGLGRMMGLQATSFFLSNEGTRSALVYMMIIAFTLYKVVQTKGLTIHTLEELVDDEEIDEILRKSKASSVANMSAMLGVDPRQALQEMVENGDITSKDLQDLLGVAGKDDDNGQKDN